MNHDLMFSSEIQTYSTPQDLFDKIDREFGFTLDACADKSNHKCKKYYNEQDNGLIQDWSGEVTWINPPYKDSKAWIKKACTEWQDHNVTSVMLIPSRTDTASWHDYVSKAAQVRFLKGRLKFSGHKNAAPFPSAIVVFSNIIYPVQCVWVDYR